jgi:hypothetical protein
MADFLTEAYYRYDFALFMAKVGVAMTVGHQAQETAVVEAETALAALRDSGVEEPADLSEHTAAAVDELEALYRTQFDSAQQQLALTPEQQEVFGVDAARAQVAATTAAAWLSAIGAVRTEEGL